MIKRIKKIVAWFKKWWWALLLTCLTLVSVSSSVYMALQTKQVISINSKLEKTLSGEIARKAVVLDNGYTYFFNLPDDMNVRLNQLCIIFRVDINIPYATVMTENSGLNVNAIHRNANGTWDGGLFQLNSKLFWTEFVPKYWPFAREPNIFNWEDNMFLAVALLADLNNKFQNPKETFCAYNCGRSATLNNRIPTSTKKYYIPTAMKHYNSVAMVKKEEK